MSNQIKSSAKKAKQSNMLQFFQQSSSKKSKVEGKSEADPIQQDATPKKQATDVSAEGNSKKTFEKTDQEIRV